MRGRAKVKSGKIEKIEGGPVRMSFLCNKSLWMGVRN